MTAAPPFVPEFTALESATPLRAAIEACTRAPEDQLLPPLVDAARLDPEQAAAASALALRLARGVRERGREGGRAGLVQGLLQEFALSSHEGVALMCLAEALLRIPDSATRDALIRDKIGRGDWQRHLGQSPSLFVNAATWGLLVTGRLVATHSDSGLGAALRRVVGRGGEPLVRKGVDLAMRLMGEQFVCGETIEQALAKAGAREAQGFRHSFDMLGEAALTADDAARYLAAYEQAVEAIGAAAAGRGVVEGPGLSVKLSALHPRHARAQVDRVHGELYPRLLALAERARRHDIGFNIDAEESERLELSLDLLERLAHEPVLAGWDGLGFVVQAYGRRAMAVIEWLDDLARRSGRRLMVRLVKGAYWDSEIKRAQQEGQADYPVWTRKVHTDVAYLACARRLLDAAGRLYPQFATHNAHTLAAVQVMAQSMAAARGAVPTFEFQCLHGMGEPLHEQVVAHAASGGLGGASRIYAPVGSHETLLAYLVRRLLENGANTSFVHRIGDASVPLESLVEDPVQAVEARAVAEGAIGRPHPAIPRPRALFGVARVNSAGLDLTDEGTLAELRKALAAGSARPVLAVPLVAGLAAPAGAALEVRNPADPADLVGEVREATEAEVEAALAAAPEGAAHWAEVAPADRAARLDAAADALERRMAELVALLVREAGKTVANAVAEVREAVDFLRYDAAELRRGFDPATHRPLGPVACISPWNFPLAIFVGQIAAALAAGNAVLAKPAEQTPLVAFAAVQVLHEAGVPLAALQLLPGRGETVGAALVADPRVQGVMFTGSTEVARGLQRTLAGRLDPGARPVPLVAETGGQNALVVDSSALPEQVVQDVLASAFDSAGQRCSALRVLCLQREIADRVLAMLAGAMREQRIGDPRRLATDVGPLIDAEARAGVERHLDAMRERGRRVVQPLADAAAALPGHFVAPAWVEIDDVAEIGREVFGPVLHVRRFDRDALPALLAEVNSSGYALTGGVHTRIDETVAQVVQQLRAGNLYVNRNLVGAVVGVQPFGGEGLSGTGPKAGGPLSMLRLLACKPLEAARTAVEAAGPAAGAGPVHGLPADAAAGAGDEADAAAALAALQGWAGRVGDDALAAACARFVAASPATGWRSLPGPTGEANLYRIGPREPVLCLAPEGDAGDRVRLAMGAAVLALGGRVLWPARDGALRSSLPGAVQERIALADDWRHPGIALGAVLHQGPPEERLAVLQALAARPGAIVGLTPFDDDGGDLALETLVGERSLSINTAAAGGNASLMAIG
ncbi:MAG: trifunctional transcriptional regulator/proline dehydrogenase/L-glutamate gamma-semialdehyde dehydrogenase [Rubrivivax sp.]|nr:trifunctional transcriptional regulator/proline dehydrogenase/L-glutamate gamma-semialdehyde dehydrogenase [Rubrivivax sp.]